ncbi:uncharacterized protein EV422DRAFT_504120 [Fimicolochytrium jonesii]|uniref:uncharacterized protein n=1 Tax=Fimicolochytrium jonesii TaxID=1396493 RepID=UPI0022FE8DE1|nr:uncharacterized protein EV422DRAFT_504118 [Fimicolochytrium jonesii]XP_052927939.1 uncharacterized protein EV422DRAFT_504120 [Fimicolochytrium jonesii]KAI8824051.1 hypothetical protein EV422DRAFT_504118 [Fimicolochytrium jonesii]KAI8824053.1 hypothetical protein EV422DRAFT_504120 [Fimicolochytrium jonesii]
MKQNRFDLAPMITTDTKLTTQAGIAKVIKHASLSRRDIAQGMLEILCNAVIKSGTDVVKRCTIYRTPVLLETRAIWKSNSTNFAMHLCAGISHQCYYRTSNLEFSIALSTPSSDTLSDMGDDHYPILTPMEADEALSQFPAGQEEPESEVYNRGRRNSFDRRQEEWDYTQRMSKEGEDQDNKPSAVPCKPGPDDTIAITLPLKRKLIPENLAPRF